jgi:sulfur-oxidizing protein SoxY
MPRWPLRWSCAVGLALALLGASVATAVAEPRDDPWPDLVRDAFNSRAMRDGTGVLVLEMPNRAEDAAIVPLTVRTILPPDDTRHVTTLTIVIDENPAPVAATFRFGPQAGVSSVSTRVRVDSYTNVHAVAELSDGQLYMVKAYVKASGGCSAPAAKSDDVANLGQMRMRQFASETPASTAREAQIMLRHPNNSGLQMDQVTRLYVPAFFVQDLEVRQGEDLIMSVDAGISISENPSIRFNYVPNGKALRARAVDTEKHVFTGEWPASPQM